MRAIASWLACGLVMAGCIVGGTGGSPTETGTGTGNKDAGDRDAGPPPAPTTSAPTTGGGDHPGTRVPPSEAPPPSGSAITCALAGDATLGTEEGTSPAIAFGSGHFAAAWIERGTVHVAMTDAGGVLGPARALPAGPRSAEPAIGALASGGFVVAWREPGRLRGLQLGDDGAPSGPAFTLASTTGGDPRPAVIRAGAAVEIAWADTSGVSACLLNGTSLGERTTIPGASDPAIACSGASAGLVFASGRRLGFTRLSPGARSADPTLFRDAPGKANVPRASPAGDGFFVAWEDDRGGDGRETVFLTRIGEDGQPAAETPVPDDTGSANYPDVATVNGVAAIVYYQFRDGPSAVYLSLFGPDLKRAADDLTISGKGGRTPRIAAGEGMLGVVYARKGAPAHLAVVSCR
jgi:hypothetical protein